MTRMQMYQRQRAAREKLFRLAVRAAPIDKRSEIAEAIYALERTTRQAQQVRAEWSARRRTGRPTGERGTG